MWQHYMRKVEFGYGYGCSTHYAGQEPVPLSRV